MAISLSQARGLVTKKLVAVYQERPPVTSFLRGFFKTTTAPTKQISIEVERMGEKIAVDVVRGSEGNRNTFSKSTEKIFEPPIYREFFDATQLDIYDRVLGSERTDNSQLFAALLNSIADKTMLLRDKIERAKERQISQIFHNGIVTLKNGDNIDYKRKSASIVDPGSGNYFANDVDVYAQFKAAGDWLRKTGKVNTGVFNVLLGDDALTDLFNNAKFLAKQNLFNMALDAVVGPVRDNQTGSVYHGKVSSGPYSFQLWSYPQYFEDPDNSNTLTPYLNAKEAVIMPVNPYFVMAHAAVPQLIGEPGQMPVQGEYVFMDFVDTRKATHEFDVQSAPLAVPVAVDHIYTLKAKA